MPLFDWERICYCHTFFTFIFKTSIHKWTIRALSQKQNAFLLLNDEDRKIMLQNLELMNNFLLWIIM
jgi:hypothetical protein